MKRIILILLLLLGVNSYVNAEEENYSIVKDQDTLFYSPIMSTWSKELQEDDDIVFKKTLIDGTGSHSIYNKADDSLGFALATDCELISNEELIIIDNNLLKYYKLDYNYGDIQQVELTDEELNKIFPQAEIFKLSQIESDNKIWIHKPFRKNKVLLLVNDTDKFYHQISCKSKGIQNPEIKGLITIPRYGIINFSHFGEYNGKLTFYIR